MEEVHKHQCSSLQFTVWWLVRCARFGLSGLFRSHNEPQDCLALCRLISPTDLEQSHCHTVTLSHWDSCVSYLCHQAGPVTPGALPVKLHPCFTTQHQPSPADTDISISPLLLGNYFLLQTGLTVVLHSGALLSSAPNKISFLLGPQLTYRRGSLGLDVLVLLDSYHLTHHWNIRTSEITHIPHLNVQNLHVAVRFLIRAGHSFH